jgi:NAD(P)H-quinone oxidoreductase subunit 5
MLAKAVSGGIRTFGRALVLIVGATIAYFAGHEIFEKLIPSMEVGPALAFRWWIVLGGLGALFLAQTILQASPSGLLARLLEPIIHSGMYLDDWFTRLTFRLWPPRLERAAAFTPSTTARPQRESRIF